MNSYKVNDGFSQLEAFTLSLPETFDSMGTVIHGNRNVVKKVTIPEGTFVIKNYRGMYFFNRLAYSLFRKSKSERSYIYSTTLNEKGIITPAPVSWLNCYAGGLLTQSYFISVFSSHPTLQRVLRDHQDNTFRVSVFHHLAAFTTRLHNLGIYHYDYSVGNLLVIQHPDKIDFAMVDLNRIQFQKVNYRKAVRNFSTLEISVDEMNLLISEYAKLSNQSPQDSVDTFWKDKKRSSLLRTLRRGLRQYTLTPLEKLFGEK
jgi:tRNA A-37 threonylcarbamoyl transferase component Bud32